MENVVILDGALFCAKDEIKKQLVEEVGNIHVLNKFLLIRK